MLSMVEAAFWRQFASISATMIGLVFLGTFYYLESGWKNFDFFQTRMEELSVNYAKIIISYFSVTLVLSLMQNQFFPQWLSILGLIIVITGAFSSTRSLNSQLKWFQSVSNEGLYLWNRIFNWVWFVFVFLFPLIFIQWGFQIAIPTISEYTINESALGWMVFGALLIGYWNLILFLLTPFKIHKLERDKKYDENKKDILKGESTSNDSWDDDRINLAEERIKTELEKSGLKLNPEFNIMDTYKTGSQLSGDISTPHLFFPPSVDENGEASVQILLPDKWRSDRDLLDRASILAYIVGNITRNAYRDLTGVEIRIHRQYLEEWNDSESSCMLLKIRWTGADMNSLATEKREADSILEAASHFLLHPTLYPLGLEDHDFDPSDREPNEEEYSFYGISDKSHNMVKRYEARVIFNKRISKDRILELIPEIIQEVREKDVYRNDQSKSKWKGEEAKVVWLHMFDEARKPGKMIAIDSMDHYLGQAEWFDSDLDPDYTPMEMIDPDQTIDGIRIKLNN